MTSDGSSNDPTRSVPPPSVAVREGFAQREYERHRARLARFDAAAMQRGAFPRHHYYAGEVRRLVKSLVPANSRILDVGCGDGSLLASLAGTRSVGIDVSVAAIEQARAAHPELELFVADVERDALPEGPYDVIVLSDTIGALDDIQIALERLHPLLAPDGRLIVTYYNFLWEPVLKAAELLGQKTKWPDQNWLSMVDIENLLYLTSFEVFRRGTDILMPANVPLVSPLLNRVGAQLPALREAALLDYFVARAKPVAQPSHLPGVSVVCPTRNEKGNIYEAVIRTPLMGSATELIFVDGNSTDGTVEEIQRVIANYRGPLKLRYISQGDGRGKADAVWKGFDAASNEVLMILDSDLTVPPEDLPKFYRALVSGRGDFINGVRLVYPMEGQAMRFLNLVGNKFFGMALSWLLEQPIKDSLCGTKVLYKRDYARIAEQRSFFGNFDNFGDFDLLFGAARLNLRIVDLPVRYRARVYGETKMDRFGHGVRLLKMTAFGFRKLRMGI
jgi:SAM-dependent methyltransferase